MHLFLAIATASVLFFTGAAASGQGKAEKLEYEVTWGYSDVASMSMQRGCPKGGYVAHAMTAESVGVADQIHEFRVRLDSFADASGRTLEGRTYVKEEGVPRLFRTRFGADGAAKVVKQFKKRENTLDLVFRGPTHDLLSWAYTLRTEKLSKGKTFTYHVWDGWKLARVEAEVVEKERVWTPAGTFSAYRVQLTRTRLHHHGDEAYQPRAKPRKLGIIWLSTDEARTPVAMDFTAPVGVAKIRLERAVRRTCE